MIWVAAILAIIILIISGHIRTSKGPVHTLESIEQPIRDLLKRGYDGGFLIINISRSKNFLQLRKYINAPGDYGIDLCFPHAGWSSQFFEKLKNLCIKTSTDFSIAKDENAGSLEFLYIDFGKDAHKAHEYLKKILLVIFELDENAKLFVRLENAAIEDKLIDR